MYLVLYSLDIIFRRFLIEKLFAALGLRIKCYNLTNIIIYNIHRKRLSLMLTLVNILRVISYGCANTLFL